MFKTLLAAEFSPYGALTGLQLEQLEGHYSTLIKWNERLNLTRIVGVEEAVRFHYCESLYLGRFLPAGNLRIADIGSGGGFPGIPIGILRPECRITLVESHQRKSVFLREAARDLENVNVLAKRAEEVGGEFDWVVSRAVVPGDVLKLRLSASVALLLGEEDASNFKGEHETVPWGNRRVLFHVER